MVRLFYTFANGKLQMLEVLENQGIQSLTKPRTNMDIFAAKRFLTNYQAYTADPLYGQLRSMLDKVDGSKNFTKTSANLVLEANVTDDCTTFKWYYTSNGAIAPYSKFITIVVEDGFLAAFVDNWHLYNVDSTSVNLSKEKAIAIALEAAKDHSWSLKLEDSTLAAKNFNGSNVRWTTLLLDGSLNADKARSEEPLALYPVWRVGIALDKWYGYMYGVQVDIWADTGEVRRVQEAWSTLPPPEGAPTANLNAQASLVSEANLAVLIALPAFVIVAVGFIVVWIGGKKKLHYYNLLKKRGGFKAGGILLCILVSSTVFLGSVATVGATTRGAAVWGSESTGAGEYKSDPDNWINWRKSKNETDYQRETAGYLAQFFAEGGYTGNNGINHQGIRNPGSSKSQIITDLSTLQNNNDYVAVVDFDHGVGRDDYFAPSLYEFHYMFEDNNGTYYNGNWSADGGVYDCDIYYLTSPKIIFAFISACMSADLSCGQGLLPPSMPPYPERALGMPFAWTGRFVADKSATPGFTITDYISDDGMLIQIGGRRFT